MQDYEFGITISMGKFIMSYKSQEPMKMQEKRSMLLNDQWEGGEVCQGGGFGDMTEEEKFLSWQ